jgi:Smg protein
MKENILDVLIYLFENYMIEDAQTYSDQESLARELAQAGFGDGDITRAFDWLEHLADLCEEGENQMSGGAPTAVRHYSGYELDRIDSMSRGLLLTLVDGGVLSPNERELVIDRLLALDTDELEPEHVKWVIMMVLSNRAENPEDYAWVEDLMFEGVRPVFH